MGKLKTFLELGHSSERTGFRHPTPPYPLSWLITAVTSPVSGEGLKVWQVVPSWRASRTGEPNAVERAATIANLVILEKYIWHLCEYDPYARHKILAFIVGDILWLATVIWMSLRICAVGAMEDELKYWIAAVFLLDESAEGRDCRGFFIVRKSYMLLDPYYILWIQDFYAWRHSDLAADSPLFSLVAVPCFGFAELAAALCWPELVY